MGDTPAGKIGMHKWENCLNGRFSAMTYCYEATSLIVVHTLLAHVVHAWS